MQKPLKFKDGVDYEKTLGGLETGDYVIVPSSSQDISAIRTAVCKAAKKIQGASFVVNKTINGARVRRES